MVVCAGNVSVLNVPVTVVIVPVLITLHTWPSTGVVGILISAAAIVVSLVGRSTFCETVVDNATVPALATVTGVIGFRNNPLVVTLPDTVNPVNVPTDVIAGWAAVVTVAAVPEVLPVTLPVKLPTNAVEVNVPVDGLNDSLVDDTLRGRLPVVVVTHTGYIEALVVVSLTIAAAVAGMVDVGTNVQDAAPDATSVVLLATRICPAVAVSPV